MTPYAVIDLFLMLVGACAIMGVIVSWLYTGRLALWPMGPTERLEPACGPLAMLIRRLLRRPAQTAPFAGACLCANTDRTCPTCRGWAGLPRDALS